MKKVRKYEKKIINENKYSQKDELCQAYLSTIMSLVCVRMTSFVNVGSCRCLNLPKKDESVTNVKINMEHFG